MGTVSGATIMNFLNFFVIILVFCQKAIASDVKPAPRCSRDFEVYNSCGSACPPTCENLSPACTKQCVPGCYCQKGFVKNNSGECVLPCRCPQVSAPRCARSHELYTECGTACPPTCDNWNENRVCTKQCVVGCQCEPGYVKNTADGSCILPSECPATASDVEADPRCSRSFEVYNSCGSACPASCDNPSPICTQQCVAGCYCQQGYVKDAAGNCVLLSQCSKDSAPQCSKSHEIYKECGTACPTTCANLKVTQLCTDQCVPECQCDQGYVRNTEDGSCCLPSECPGFVSDA